MAVSAARTKRVYSRTGVTNNPNGQPEYEPTKVDRQLVVVMSGLKVPQHIMATKLDEGRGIDPKTLRKYFQADMTDGREHLITSLKAQIVQQAMNGSTRATTWLLERLDPEQFAPRYTLPLGTAGSVPLIEGSVDAKVEIYLPDNGRGIAEPVSVFPPEIDGELDGR